MKHYTSIKQSKKLLELGLNPESADMYYGYDDHFTVNPTEKDYSIEIGKLPINTDSYLIPCWSLNALLEVMPKIKEFYYPSLYKSSFSVTACMYSTQEHDILIIYTGEGFLEAAFNMVVWLLENGYIKKESKSSSE